MTQRETIQRAYGNAPRDIPHEFDFLGWVLDLRALRYIWVRWIVKKFFR